VNRDDVDELAFFRGLPLALGLGALCWAALAAFGFAIYAHFS